jgi:energy-coupling factor transporter transmembrane protein EcfT
LCWLILKALKLILWFISLCFYQIVVTLLIASVPFWAFLRVRQQMKIPWGKWNSWRTKVSPFISMCLFIFINKWIISCTNSNPSHDSLNWLNLWKSTKSAYVYNPDAYTKKEWMHSNNISSSLWLQLWWMSDRQMYFSIIIPELTDL